MECKLVFADTLDDRRYTKADLYCKRSGILLQDLKLSVSLERDTACSHDSHSEAKSADEEKPLICNGRTAVHVNGGAREKIPYNVVTRNDLDPDIYGTAATVIIGNEGYDTSAYCSRASYDGAHVLQSDSPTANSSTLSQADSQQLREPEGGPGIYESDYMEPACHKHLDPGPKWKSYHDYDPVYIPQSDPSAMARRLDKSGYVTSKHQRQLTLEKDTQHNLGDTYEDVPVYSEIEPGTTPLGGGSTQGASATPPPPLPPVMRPLSRVRLLSFGSPQTHLPENAQPSANGIQVYNSGRRALPSPTPPSCPSTPAPRVPHHAFNVSTSAIESEMEVPPPRPIRSTSRGLNANHLQGSVSDLLRAGVNNDSFCQRNHCASSPSLSSIGSDELYEPVGFPQ